MKIRPVPDIAFAVILILLNGQSAADDFEEGWESTAPGSYSPIDQFIEADEGTWLIGDTVSAVPECGASPHLAEVNLVGGSQALTLVSEDTNSSCSDNIWVAIREIGQLNPGFSIPLARDTFISFKEDGSLVNPRSASDGCIVLPCGDTVSIVLQEFGGTQLAYVLQRAPDAEPNERHDFYREIFLDPDRGSYVRNLFDDFMTIPNFNPGSSIGFLQFGVHDHGTATLDDLTISQGAPPGGFYEIGTSTSGLWYNQAQSGHGLVIQVIDTAEGHKILVYWFVYQDGAQVWLGGVGDISGDLAHVPLLVTSGTGFPPDFNAEEVVLIEWGDLMLRFVDDDSVDVSWTTEQSGFANGRLEMTRLTRIAQPANFSSCLSGAYYNVDQSGHGILAEVVRQGEEDVLVVTWFVYLDNQQVWLQGTGTLANSRATLNMIRPVGGTFPPQFNPDDIVLSPWGAATFDFHLPDSLTMSWETSEPGFQSGSLEMSRLTVLAGQACPD